MMDKYSVHYSPEVKRLQVDPVSKKSPVWQYLFAVTPYILTIAVTGTPPSAGPKFHLQPKLCNPTPVDIFRLQDAYKQCSRVSTNVLVCGGSTADNLSMVAWCQFLPAGKSAKHLLEVRAVMNEQGIFILEVFLPKDR